jgi:hypothetical protein
MSDKLRNDEPIEKGSVYVSLVDHYSGILPVCRFRGIILL